VADRDLIERLRACLEAEPRVRLAILYGSAARDRLRPGSDLDLAVELCETALPLAAELDLAVELERRCGRAVHLVRIDQASHLLRWQIAKHGIVVLSRPPIARVLFLARTAAEQADFGEALLDAARRYRRRLLEVAR
jgi:predicted nucleotidyltransferase